jgi:hypothetical protein
VRDADAYAAVVLRVPSYNDEDPLYDVDDLLVAADSEFRFAQKCRNCWCAGMLSWCNTHHTDHCNRPNSLSRNQHGIPSPNAARYLTDWPRGVICYRCWHEFGHKYCPSLNVREICYMAYLNHKDALLAAIRPFLPAEAAPHDFESYCDVLSHVLIDSEKKTEIVFVKDLVFNWMFHYRAELTRRGLLARAAPPAI